jgi:hypothetical protein
LLWGRLERGGLAPGNRAFQSFLSVLSLEFTQEAASEPYYTVPESHVVCVMFEGGKASRYVSI